MSIQLLQMGTGGGRCVTFQSVSDEWCLYLDSDSRVLMEETSRRGWLAVQASARTFCNNLASSEVFFELSYYFSLVRIIARIILRDGEHEISNKNRDLLMNEWSILLGIGNLKNIKICHHFHFTPYFINKYLLDTIGNEKINFWPAHHIHSPFSFIILRDGNGGNSCYHKCTTFTKPIQLLKKEFVSAFYVSILLTNEKSSHRAAEGRKWKNKFRKSVRAVVFNPTCVSIYNLSIIEASP